MMHSPRECENVQWKIPLDSNRDDRLWPMNVRRDTRLPALEVATYLELIMITSLTPLEEATWYDSSTTAVM